MNAQADILKDAKYRTSPTSQEVMDDWISKNANKMPVHDQRWDVSNPDIYANHTWPEIFAEMRKTAPINKITGTPQGDYWSITTVKAIQHVEALPKIFSSDYRVGGMVIQDSTEEAKEEGRGAGFIAIDPPEHTVKRRTVSPAFTPSEMVRLTSLVRERTCELLDGLPIGEQFDWVDKVSTTLTTGMLATIFDFPWDRREVLSYWSDWMSDLGLGMAPELNNQRQEVMMEMAGCFHKLWEDRANSEPGPDLLSRMIHSDGMSAMGPMEFMNNMSLLIVGGNDTTRNTMTGIMHLFDQFPEERAKLEQNPDLIPNAVQECIRLITPVAHMRRTAVEDYELDSQLIKKGDKVILWYISANRDESVFEDSNRLMVDRENARRHVAFGYGVHRCVGARLAELQLRILIEEMIARKMHVRVTGKVQRLRQNFIHGYQSAEVTIERG